MTLEEAKEFVVKCMKNLFIALGLAMNRDCSSGGFIRMVNITEEKVTREVVTFDNVPY